jgi:CheY-like chemotaxis protein
MLQVHGYGVVLASGGEEALRLSCDSRHSIDLALLDIMMPGLNGIELAARLRAAHPVLPVVLMSGYSLIEIKRLVGEHPYRVIWKPFKTDSLVRMIDNALGESTSATA